MFQSRSMVMAVIATLMLSLPPLVLAEEATPAAPSTSQVEQLQAQLAEMQKEMAAMRQAIEGSGDIPAEKRQMMEGHMGRMQQHMQGMQDQCRRMGGMMGMGEMKGSGEKQGMGGMMGMGEMEGSGGK